MSQNAEGMVMNTRKGNRWREKRPKSCAQTLQDARSKAKPVTDGISIHYLPNEILEYIFTFLNVKERLQSELVCRRWREIGRTLWWSWPTKLDVRELKSSHLKKTIVTDDIIYSILSRCGTSLKELVLSIEVRGFKLTSKVLGIIGKNCPNLIDIKLGLAGLPTQDLFTNWYLINLAKGCTKLHKIAIGRSYDFDDANLSLFLKQCHSLECLDLMENRAIIGECFGALNQNLKAFYVHRCEHLNSAVVVNKLLSRCDNIVELGLVGCCKLSAPLLSKAVDRYQNSLKILFLDEHSMKPSDWCEILAILKNLEELSLCGSVGVEDSLMKVLTAKCKKLRELTISETDVTDVGLSALAVAPSLHVLDVSYTRSITGIGIGSVAIQGRLKQFHFTDIERDANLVEESCILFANCCSDFSLLDVRDNRNITDHLVEEFRSSLERGFLKGPVSLYVSGTLVNEEIKGCDKLQLFFHDDDIYDEDEDYLFV